MDIKKLASLPESQTLEFKRNIDSLDSLLNSVIAFANTNGGIILVGVDDDGSIIGVSDAGKMQEKIANAIDHRIQPQLLPDINPYEVDGKLVLIIQIDHLPAAPYYFADKGEEKGAFIRLGNSNRLAGKETINEIKRASHNPFFDKMACDKAFQEDLDIDLIKSVFFKQKFDIDTAKLISLGILTKKGKKIVATNGGVILFGKPDIRQTFFPFAEVRCARFAGTTKSEFIDRLNIDGGIIGAIEEVPKFIRRNTKMAGKFGEMQRRDISEYPVEGIREALTNALVHANYEISGMRIFIAIYSNRLEIQNPGIMPPGMNIEQFKAGVSRIRNPVLARAFGELNLIEEWGSGYKRINDNCQKGGYPEPLWEEFVSALRVTFFPHPEFNQEEDKHIISNIGYEGYEHLSLRQRNIIDYIAKQEEITLNDLMSGIDDLPAERTVQDELNKLKELGILRVIGFGRGSKWALTESAQKDAERRGKTRKDASK